MIWFVLLVLWPLAELYVIIKLSEAIGFLWVILLLIVSWPVGWRLIRHQGRAALRHLRDALLAGRTADKEVLDGALVLFGALLLLVPGFITDAVGVLLLLPPTRALVRPLVARNQRSAWLTRLAGAASWNPGRGGRHRPDDYDAEATAADVNEPQLKA
ncbi:FxsA family protein [Conexibacter sp. S30A1]|jgi:UPF0716 protein FxsA|uniref:FxsA family protein n=1 Tax=Conexibacter sp. S30A1 TaxID=2937800 RepID=UPI00200C126C|nr:FxsA family protein [Conexibacter sp. S30A1]